MKSVGVAFLLATSFALAGCNQAGNSPSAQAAQAASSTPAPASARTRLSRDEVLAAYAGKTVTGSGHATSYRNDGTWTNKNGQSGTYSVTSDGILVMQGDLNMRLEVFRDGQGFYNRNTVSGQGGRYTAG